MHDPMTVAFDIRLPFWWMKYKPTLATIWHVDPEKDGTDDSCGWFMRSRHGDPEVLERIVKRFECDWDRVFKSESGAVYNCGLFKPDGQPNLSVQAICLTLFHIAANETFGSDGRTNWRKARKFLRAHLIEIMGFAENTTDSLFDSITRKYEIGCNEEYTPHRRRERIERMAGVIYSWILRASRPWYKHPRWHIHHWKIQIPLIQNLKRWLFSRCQRCGRRFAWGESVISSNWDSTGPLWFRSEEGVRHSSCEGAAHGVEKTTEKESVQAAP